MKDMIIELTTEPEEAALRNDALRLRLGFG
jgi:hypothetical protein